MTWSHKFLREIAFGLCTIVTAGLFCAFAAWAMSRLDPAAQETIGLTSSQLIFATANPKQAGAERASFLSVGCVFNRRDPTIPND